MISRRPGDRARSQLGRTRFRQVEWVSETGSTNADLMARAHEAGVDGTVRVADFQNAGRGRRGRTWVTEPSAALMVSVLVRPGPLGLRPPQLGRLTMALGVGAAEACGELFGVDVGLKWPNDLVPRPDDRKLAGILAESAAGPTA
ncbi:MAG: biotin--[acetyl-CoA-carboxylase] ligase, partial [Acidimicrobiia bacterium]|nr:biotin--[acetyl-CoA-carboxylase] ligase [Acidimicrobiia bacterium]